MYNPNIPNKMFSPSYMNTLKGPRVVSNFLANCSDCRRGSEYQKRQLYPKLKTTGQTAFLETVIVNTIIIIIYYPVNTVKTHHEITW